MEIAVDGTRVSPGDWEAIRKVPPEGLVPLTPPQREVARKLGIPEEDYARSAMAGERGQELLLRKTEILAKLLQRRLAEVLPGATVRRVVLRTLHDRFDMDVEDTDDMGLWIRVSRGDGDHILLVRCEYVLSRDFVAGEMRTAGLRG